MVIFSHLCSNITLAGHHYKEVASGITNVGIHIMMSPTRNLHVFDAISSVYLMACDTGHE